MYKYSFCRLGLDTIHELTTDRDCTLHVDLTDWLDESRYAEYGVFSVGSEESGYELQVEEFSGTAGDSLTYHHGYKFTTYDNDQDTHSTNCADSNGGGGGWWFRGCSQGNLNGEYRSPPDETQSDQGGIRWIYWKYPYSFKSSMMSINCNF